MGRRGKQLKRKQSSRATFAYSLEDRPNNREIQWFINLKKNDPNLVRLMLSYIKLVDQPLANSLVRLTEKVHEEALEDVLLFLVSIPPEYFNTKKLLRIAQIRPKIYRYLPIFMKSDDHFIEFERLAKKKLTTRDFDLILDAEIDPSRDIRFFFNILKHLDRCIVISPKIIEKYFTKLTKFDLKFLSLPQLKKYHQNYRRLYELAIYQNPSLSENRQIKEFKNILDKYDEKLLENEHKMILIEKDSKKLVDSSYQVNAYMLNYGTGLRGFLRELIGAPNEHIYNSILALLKHFALSNEPGTRTHVEQIEQFAATHALKIPFKEDLFNRFFDLRLYNAVVRALLEIQHDYMFKTIRAVDGSTNVSFVSLLTRELCVKLRSLDREDTQALLNKFWAHRLNSMLNFSRVLADYYEYPPYFLDYIFTIMQFFETQGRDLFAEIKTSTSALNGFLYRIETYIFSSIEKNPQTLLQVFTIFQKHGLFSKLLELFNLKRPTSQKRKKGKSLKKFNKRKRSFILETLKYINEIPDQAVFSSIILQMTPKIIDAIPIRFFILLKGFTDRFIENTALDRLKQFRKKFILLDQRILNEHHACFYKSNEKWSEFCGIIKKREGCEIPDIQTSIELSKITHISWTQILRLLKWPRLSRWTPYREFTIPKRSGGVRKISAPHSYLKRLQLWIKNEILDKIVPHPNAHGFIASKSIITNAAPHVGADLIINIDLQNFFTTIFSFRVSQIFYAITGSKSISMVFTILCTDVTRIVSTVERVSYYISAGYRFLPQGAPTSPMLSNLAFYLCDNELAEYCQNQNIVYSRYADDLTFSFSKAPESKSAFFDAVFKICKKHHFFINNKKIHVLCKAAKQSVTGLVVNEAVHVQRSYHNKIRGLLHKYEHYPPESEEERIQIKKSIEGRIAFVHAVQPEKASKYRAWLEKIEKKP